VSAQPKTGSQAHKTAQPEASSGNGTRNKQEQLPFCHPFFISLLGQYQKVQPDLDCDKARSTRSWPRYASGDPAKGCMGAPVPCGFSTIFGFDIGHSAFEQTNSLNTHSAREQNIVLV
jgi:hypothetical protein